MLKDALLQIYHLQFLFRNWCLIYSVSNMHWVYQVTCNCCLPRGSDWDFAEAMTFKHKLVNIFIKC